MSKPKPKQAKQTNWFDGIFTNPSQPYVVIIIVSLLVYIRVITFGLVHFDDHGFVLLSADMLKLSNIPAFFTHSVFWVFGEANKDNDVYYRPLQNVVYTICNTISPRQAWPYHLMGLVFHVLACCALFNFFGTLKYTKPVSLLFTLIYCVHPTLVQGVAWIAGIGDQMATLFVLLSATYFIKLISDKNGLNKKYLSLHLLCFVTALFSKEVSLLLIPLCLFYLLFIQKNKTSVNTTISLATGWVVPAIIFLVLRKGAISASQANFITSAISSIKVNGPLLFEYVEKIFLPYRLNPMPSRDDAHYLPGAVILLVLIVSAIVTKRFNALFLFGLLWFLVFLMPTFFQVNPQTPFYAFEHRLYLPLAGMLIMLMELCRANQLKLRTSYYKYGLSALIVLLAVVTFSYAGIFKDAYVFHDKVIELSPRAPLVYNGYAEIMLGDKKYAEAIDMYKKSFEFLPTDINTSGKIGDIYMTNLNDAPNAIIWFKKTLDISPNTIEAAVSIADAYNNILHDTANAALWYKNALKINPRNEFALTKLGLIYINEGRLADGRKQLLASLEQDEKNLTAYQWIAISYFNENKIEDALSYLTKAYAYFPNEADLQKNLLICYYKLNNYEQTKKFAEIYSAGGNQVPGEIAGYLQRR